MLSATADRLLHFVPSRYQATAKQFIKFGITGTIGAVVDFGTYALLTRALGWTTRYTVLGTEIIAANNVSVFLAICSNFIINRTWTFHDVHGNAAKQGAGYLVLNVFTWALNQVLVALFSDWGLFMALFGESRDFVAKALAIVLILFVNFFGSKFFIFRKGA